MPNRKAPLPKPARKPAPPKPVVLDAAALPPLFNGTLAQRVLLREQLAREDAAPPPESEK